MTWQGNPRTTTPEWRALRQFILRRDAYTCHVCRRRCATQVDHLRTYADCLRHHLDPDLPTNLAAICEPCHRAKSSSEGNAERSRLAVARRRPTQPHPGLLPVEVAHNRP